MREEEGVRDEPLVLIVAVVVLQGTRRGSGRSGWGYCTRLVTGMSWAACGSVRAKKEFGAGN